MIVHRLIDVTAIAEIDAGFIKIDTLLQLNKSAILLAGLADIVDYGAGGLRSESRSLTAANAFDSRNRCIIMRPVIVVAELDIAEQYGGEAIFLELHERRAAGCNRKAAHRNVGVTAGARGARDLNAREQTKHFRL